LQESSLCKCDKAWMNKSWGVNILPLGSMNIWWNGEYHTQHNEIRKAMVNGYGNYAYLEFLDDEGVNILPLGSMNIWWNGEYHTQHNEIRKAMVNGYGNYAYLEFDNITNWNKKTPKGSR